MSLYAPVYITYTLINTILFFWKGFVHVYESFPLLGFRKFRNEENSRKFRGGVFTVNTVIQSENL